MRLAGLVSVAASLCLVVACGSEEPEPPKPTPDCDASFCVSPATYTCSVTSAVMSVKVSKARPEDGLASDYILVTQADDGQILHEGSGTLIGSASITEIIPAVDQPLTAYFYNLNKEEVATRSFDPKENCATRT